MDYKNLELTSQVANVKINCGYGGVPTNATCVYSVDGSISCGSVTGGFFDGAQSILGKASGAAPSFCTGAKGSGK
jgi:hypothetical protein